MHLLYLGVAKFVSTHILDSKYSIIINTFKVACYTSYANKITKLKQL